MLKWPQDPSGVHKMKNSQNPTREEQYNLTAHYRTSNNLEDEEKRPSQYYIWVQVKRIYFSGEIK